MARPASTLLLTASRTALALSFSICSMRRGSRSATHSSSGSFLANSGASSKTNTSRTKWMCVNSCAMDGPSIALVSNAPSGRALSRLTRMVLFRSQESSRASSRLWSGASGISKHRSTEVYRLRISDILPKLSARIIGIQLCQLPQNFLRALVARHGDRRLDLNDLISTCAFLRGRWNALLAQPKLLAGLGSGWNLEHRAAINGRNLDLGAERRFANAHRNGQVNIVALPMKDRMISGANDHIEVAGRSSMGSGVAFAGNANALAIARTSFDTDFKRFGLLYGSFAKAGATGCYVFPSAMAARAGRIELHASAGLRDLTSAAAFGTRARRFDIAVTVAGSADNAPGDVQLHDAAPDSRPEGDVDLIFQICPLLRPFVCRAAASSEHTGKNVFEASAATGFAAASSRSFEQVREVEAAEVIICALTAGALRLSAREPSGESGRRPS